MGIVGGSGGTVRSFFTTMYGASEATVTCLPLIDGSCNYIGTPTVGEFRLEMASRRADGSVEQTVVAEEIIEDWSGVSLYYMPRVVADADGRIHTAMYEGGGPPSFGT